MERDIRINIYLWFVMITGFFLFTLPFIPLLLQINYSEFINIITFSEVRTTIILSIITAIVSTIIALFLGLGIAYTLAFWDFPFKQVIDTFSTLPMVLPPSVAGYLLLMTFGRFGLLGKPILSYFGVTIMFSTYAIVLAQVFVVTPFVFTSTKSAFLDIHPNQIKAASTLGADSFQILKEIILPLSKKGVMAGAIMAFARAIGEFGASVMVAGLLETMPIAIFNMAMGGHKDEANVIAFLLIIISFSMLFIFKQFIGEER